MYYHVFCFTVQWQHFLWGLVADSPVEYPLKSAPISLCPTFILSSATTCHTAFPFIFCKWAYELKKPNSSSPVQVVTGRKWECSTTEQDTRQTHNKYHAVTLPFSFSSLLFCFRYFPCNIYFIIKLYSNWYCDTKQQALALKHKDFTDCCFYLYNEAGDFLFIYFFFFNNITPRFGFYYALNFEWQVCRHREQ